LNPPLRNALTSAGYDSNVSADCSYETSLILKNFRSARRSAPTKPSTNPFWPL